MATADPTMEFLARFDDPGQWDDIVPNVPICIPHVRKTVDKDGQPVTYTVDLDRMQEIADNINRLLEDQGVVLPMTKGHRVKPTREEPVVPQSKQPPILAYGRGATVGKWGPKKKWAVLTTMYVRKGCGGEVEELPFRSMEFYPGANEIRGVALQSTDPALDMGMCYYRLGENLYFYDMEAAMPDPTKPPDKEETIKKPQEDDLADSLGTPEKIHEHYRKHAHLMEHYAKFHKHLEHYATMTPLSGTNGAMPEPHKPPETEHMDKGGDPVLYARFKAMDERVRQMEERTKKAEARADRMSENYEREHCDNILASLKRDGYPVSAEKHLPKLLKMSEAERLDWETEVRENYTRDPAAVQDIQVYQGPMPGDGGQDPNEFYEADMKDADQYMKAHPGCDWEDARKFAIENRAKRRQRRA